MCVRHEDDNPAVEEFWLPLRLAVGRDFCRGTSLATMAQFLVVYFRLLSQVVVV